MKYLLLFLLSISFTINSYAQTMTLYEKKRYSLQVQFLRNLGIDETLLKKSSTISDLEKLLAAGDLLQKLNTEIGIRLMLALERELKDAEKLKTSVDFQRDKAKKQEAERKKQIELTKQKEKQIQDEINKKEQQKKRRFENSDFVAVRDEIKESFNDWYQKGEFEKSDDYQTRININSTQAFDSICYKKLLQAFKQKSGFSSHLLKYNADTEKFGVKFTLNDLTFKDSVSIPIDKAEKFKNDFEDFSIYVEDKDWVFMDNYLFPDKIYLNNRYTKQNAEFKFSNIEAKKIEFFSSEFGSSFPPIKATFNFDAFYAKHATEQSGADIIKIELSDDYEKIFDKVEIEAQFPGGDAKWRQYLERNCNAQVATNNRAPEGTYTVIVQFVVDKEGAVSDVKSLTNHGYGMEEEAIRVIKKGPNWTSAVQNGRQVKAYRKLPITFHAISE